MEARHLIALLESLDGDVIIEIFDPDAEDWMPVTGMLSGGKIGGARLYSDEP